MFTKEQIEALKEVIYKAVPYSWALMEDDERAILYMIRSFADNICTGLDKLVKEEN